MFQMLYFRNCLLCSIVYVVVASGSPKFDDGGFIPSSLSYLEKTSKTEDQVAMPSEINPRTAESVNRGDADTKDVIDRGQEARFGFTNIGSTGSGYGVSTYAPGKIDLGGLLLGAIIGVGSILIIPKLLYVLSGTYGAYARSEEYGFAQTMTKLDDALARHGIDTTSCMQRAVCTYSQQAATAVKDAIEIQHEEKVSSFNKIVDTVTTNQVFHTAMQGTAIQEAVEAGRAGRNCSRVYHHCAFSMETVISLLSNIMAAAAATNARVNPTAAANL